MIYKKLIRVTAVVLVSLLNISGFSQEKNISISLIYPDGIHGESWIKEISRSTFKDSVEAIGALDKFRDKYLESGYLAAGFDSIDFRDNVYRAVFDPGIKYEWGRIDFLSQLPPGIKKLPPSIERQSGKTIKASVAEKLRQNTVELFENNGYPFAAAYYESVFLNGNMFNAGIIVDPGPEVYIDSIVSRTNNVISGKVLEQIIRIRKGMPYSEKKIRNANRQLKNNEILSLAGPIEVGFFDDKARVYVSPRKRRSNSFDGLIGLAPAGTGAGSLSVTGSLDLVLNNTFRQAERFNIFWKAPGNQNQSLKAGLEFPWVFGWPVGVSGDFLLYKKDSSYLDTELKLGILASISLNNKLGFYYRQKGSNILLNNPGEELAGYSVKLYGFSWKYANLQNPVNPSRGVSMETELGIGRKEYGQADNETLNRVHWESSLLADAFLPFSDFLVLNLGVNGAHISGENEFENEKHRLGGIYSLRGFDEESLLAESYVIGTVELRYLFSRNSNFHLFADAGKWWSRTDDNIGSGFPLGAGLGISLETNAGVIMLDYALGRSEEIPFSLRNGKIHIGIKSIF